MKVDMQGLINRLDDLRERLNELFEKLEKLEDLDYDIAVEDVEQYFQNDDAFNLSIALAVLEQVEKLDNALEIIKNKKVDAALLMSCCCYKQYCDFYIKRWEDVENIQKFLPTIEEYNLLKEMLL